ncbi:MAG: ferritin-like domain-containing protein [Ilumatobacteraceae bacterium]
MDMQNLSRRRFLLASGATVSLGALISACGGGGSKSGIARVGLAPEPADLPTAEVTDVTLLRTATSLEYNAIFVYEAAKDAGYLSGDAAKLALRFQADHKEHAAATASLTEAAGGNPFTDPNPRLQSIYVEPALGLIASSDDPASDVLALAYALETLAGATYQFYVPMLRDKALRGAAMGIGEQEARHAATLGSVLNPARLVSSQGLAVDAKWREEGDASLFYAVPGAFGTLAPVQVTLGPADSRTTVNLETPSLNSMVYEYLDGE